VSRSLPLGLQKRTVVNLKSLINRRYIELVKIAISSIVTNLRCYHPPFFTIKILLSFLALDSSLLPSIL